MDTADLKVFEAVARTGGMNRAAAELHTVQSNVTARIHALEAELEVQLAGHSETYFLPLGIAWDDAQPHALAQQLALARIRQALLQRRQQVDHVCRRLQNDNVYGWFLDVVCQ